MLMPLLFLLCQTGYWEVSDLGIYRPLHKLLVEAPAADELIVLDPQEAVVHLIAHGQDMVKRIGGKGQGPGEMNSPMAVFATGDRLYVRDLDRLHVFNRKGDFIKRVPTPTGYFFNKCVDGWLAHTVQGLGGSIFEVIWWDEALVASETLLSWPSNDSGRDMPLTMVDHSTLDLSYDRHWACVRQEGTSKIHILDLKRKKRVHIIQKNHPRVEIPEKNIKDYVKRRNAFFAAKGLQAEPQTFPKYFPAVSFVSFGLNNQIIVSRSLEDGFERTAFTIDGEEIPLDQVEGGALAYVGGWAFIGVFDADRGAGIVRVPRDAVAQYVKDHPSDYSSAFQ